MEKTALSLIAALGAAVAASSASASAPASSADKIMNPTSVAELLDPVPNAASTLNELQSRDGRMLEPVEVAEVGLAIGPDGVRMYNRHHHHYRREYVRHHHHRHHHHHFYHHHHHHNSY